MWVVRELARLFVRVVIAVAIASLIAGVKAAASGGGMLHTWRITLFAFAALMLLLAGAGSRESSANRRVNQRVDHAANFILRIPGIPATTEGPTLTASAVFVGSALVLAALAIVV